MHFGKLNPKAFYIMVNKSGNEQDIKKTSLESDFVVIYGDDLKWSMWTE